MKRLRWQATLCMAAALAVAPAAPAIAAAARAPRSPDIGYVYPAGGRQGATFEVAIAGRYLDGVSGVVVSGGGVQATVIEHVKPLNGKEMTLLRDRLKEIQELMKPAKGGNNKSGADAGQTADANSQGEIDRAALQKEMGEIKQKLANPKNRNRDNPQLAEDVRLRVVLAADAEPGRRELRLVTAAGLSNPRVFHVGQLPEYVEKEPNNKTGETGELLALPLIVNGQIMPGDVDCFRFEARKGWQLVAAAGARELIPYLADGVPGWFQATLTLYDPNGNELAYDDDYRFHPDPVLYCEIPQDGEYVLEIKDAIYRGREDFVYRIVLGELPFVTSIFPLGGRVGDQTTVKLTGWNLPVNELTVDAKDKEPGVLPVSVRKGELARPSTGGLVSNSVPFALDTLPECLEKEPNPAPILPTPQPGSQSGSGPVHAVQERAQANKIGAGQAGAQPLALPIIVNGRIDQPDDWDVFRFDGRAGDEIIAEVYARRLDSPLDSVLKLTDAAGLQLAFNDDHQDKGAGLTTHHADSLLRIALPADGTYYLQVCDAQHKGGEAYSYRLRISPPMPDFELRVVPSTINARAGATVPITVYALRKDGFSGEIALSLKDAPAPISPTQQPGSQSGSGLLHAVREEAQPNKIGAGFALIGGRVPADKDQVNLSLKAPPTSIKEPISLSIEGRAVIKGREIVRPAVPADDMMQAFYYRHLVPAKELRVAVTGRGKPQAPAKSSPTGPGAGQKPAKSASAPNPSPK